MVPLRRPVRQTGNTPLQIPRTTPAGDLGKEVAGSQAVGGIPHRREEIPVLLNMGG